MARILVVDDTKVSREILRTLLEADGHEIVGEAANGADGVQQFKDLRPDVTTMDITMPVLNGIEALKMIMEDDPSAKVIMVTSAGQNSKVVECMMLGASDFLTKPFEAEKISMSVSHMLSTYE